jgi:hypothetical protein
MKYSFVWLRLAVLHLIVLLALAPDVQAKSPLSLTFLKAKMASAIGEQEVLVLIQVTGAARDLPPKPDNDIHYQFDDGPEQLTSLDGDGDGRVVIYSKDLREKAPLIYQCIAKELNRAPDFCVLALYVKVPPDVDVERMRLTLTLRPKSNPKVRVSRQFSFAIEPY